jgi:hypothetical protein
MNLEKRRKRFKTTYLANSTPSRPGSLQTGIGVSFLEPVLTFTNSTLPLELRVWVRGGTIGLRLVWEDA